MAFSLVAAVAGVSFQGPAETVNLRMDAGRIPVRRVFFFGADFSAHPVILLKVPQMAGVSLDVSAEAFLVFPHLFGQLHDVTVRLELGKRGL